MPIQNVGDMSQHFQTLRQVSETKSSLNRLSNELATQKKSDITASLGGATGQLDTLNREINRLNVYSGVTQQVAQRLSFMQSTLAGVESLRDSAMNQFLGITQDSRVDTVQDAAEMGEATFKDFTAAFNKRLGEFALFSGTATDRAPLANADDMLTDIRSAIGGLNTSEDIIAAVDTWFTDPAGGFATMGYLGDTGSNLDQKIGTNGSVTINARADNDEVIELLKSAALAALADEQVPGLTQDTRAELVASSGALLLSAGDGLTDMRARLGASEAQVSEASTTLATQITAFSIDRNALTTADPFETATRLQDVQQQLEMQYSVTARLSQLSLVNFLR